MFKRYYIVRVSTASLSIKPENHVVKAFTRKGAYKKVKNTLPARYYVTDVHKISRRFVKVWKRTKFLDPDKRYDI